MTLISANIANFRLLQEFLLTKPGDPKATPRPPRIPSREGPAHEPGWADGLRKLYDSVVEEPLPDSFEDLLKKLDKDPKCGD